MLDMFVLFFLFVDIALVLFCKAVWMVLHGCDVLQFSLWVKVVRVAQQLVGKPLLRQLQVKIKVTGASAPWCGSWRPRGEKLWATTRSIHVSQGACHGAILL